MLKQSWAGFALLAVGALLMLMSGPGAFAAALSGLAVLAAIRLAGERSLHGISYERTATETRLFCGEEVRISFTLSNVRRWPAAWVTVREQVPRGLTPTEGSAGLETGSSYSLDWTLPVGAGMRTTYARSFRCVKRGLQHIGSTQLESGDPLGLVRRERLCEERLRLVVYPRLLPLVDRALPHRRPLGDRAARGWLFPDYSFYAGVRAYQPGDPRRLVHWRATARAGELQTKTFQPSLSSQLALVVNVDTLPHVWLGQREDALETVLMTAASLAREAIERHEQVSLLINGASPGIRGGAIVPPGTGYDHLRAILEVLASVTTPAVCTLADLVTRSRSLPPGATVAVISACTDDVTLSELAALQQGGRPVCLVTVGEAHQSVAAPTVPRRRVGEEERWRERSEIAFI